MEEVKTCVNHILHASQYKKNEVPVKLFLKDPTDPTKGVTKSCRDCRDFRNKYLKDKRLILKNKYNQEYGDGDTRICQSNYHTSGISNHKKEQVPVILFFKDPLDASKGENISCKDCLNYNRKIRENKRNKIKQKAEEAKNKGNKICVSIGHDYISVYKRDMVPPNLFFKDTKNSKGKEYTYCYDCRHYGVKTRENRINKKEEMIKLYETEEYRGCSSDLHTINKSPFPFYQVPIKFFYQNPEDPTSKICKKCFHCRYSVVERADDDMDFQPCIDGHSEKYSPYPKNKVPVYLFLQNPEDPKTLVFKSCYHCRMRKRKTDAILISNRKVIHEENLRLINEGCDIISCSSGYHHLSDSLYVADKVPLEKFYKYKNINDPLAGYSKSCSDCKEYKRDYYIKLKNKHTTKAELNGINCCNLCKREITEEERATNKNGIKSLFCYFCKEKQNKKSERFKQGYLDFKLKTFKESQCSCLRCKKIFLKPDEDSIIVIKLETYTKSDEIRYVRYKNIEYEASSFLQIHKDLLEYTCIQYDHMPENEVREENKLQTDEEFLGKTVYIPKATNSYIREREGKICQNLCVECHILITILRENKEDKHSKLKRIKRDYVNDLKKEGCSCCGYNYDNIPEIEGAIEGYKGRFFDMDHTDRTQKTACVSYLVNNISTTLQEVIDECNKCRVLCKFCHFVYTRIQRKELDFYLHKK